MAVRWNQSGTNLLALRNLLPPILYDPFNPKKALEFDSDCYYNACTMKSCSFAGDHDEFVLSGKFECIARSESKTLCTHSFM